MKTKPDTSGMHRFIYHTHSGTEIECFLKRDDRGTTIPGCDYGITLVYALIEDTNVREIMASSVVGFIETVALGNIQKTQSNFFNCGGLG